MNTCESKNMIITTTPLALPFSSMYQGRGFSPSLSVYGVGLVVDEIIPGGDDDVFLLLIFFSFDLPRSRRLRLARKVVVAFGIARDDDAVPILKGVRKEDDDDDDDDDDDEEEEEEGKERARQKRSERREEHRHHHPRGDFRVAHFSSAARSGVCKRSRYENLENHHHFRASSQKIQKQISN